MPWQVGADGLGGTANRDAEQFVEGMLLDVVAAEVLAELNRAPHRRRRTADRRRDSTVSRSTCSQPARFATRLGAAWNSNSTTCRWRDATLGELVLDRAQLVEVLTSSSPATACHPKPC
ncbi:MAG: hypothetical protein R2713_15855 [Ilumatobacteraceae bacterium]